MSPGRHAIRKDPRVGKRPRAALTAVTTVLLVVGVLSATVWITPPESEPPAVAAATSVVVLPPEVGPTGYVVSSSRDLSPELTSFLISLRAMGVSVDTRNDTAILDAAQQVCDGGDATDVIVRVFSTLSRQDQLRVHAFVANHCPEEGS